MKIVLALLLVAIAARGDAQAIIGRVVGITDGDTLTFLEGGKTAIKVRLAQIDAPERRQPWGTRSKQALSDLAFGRTARVDVVTLDRWGRTVAEVTVDGRNVSEAMIRSGDAWAYRQYLTKPALLSVEANARLARRGLWSLPATDTVPPWEWRRQRHNE